MGDKMEKILSVRAQSIKPSITLFISAKAKVMKADLRKEGVTPDTWDREAAGLRVRREKFSA